MVPTMSYLTTSLSPVLNREYTPSLRVQGSFSLLALISSFTPYCAAEQDARGAVS